MADYTNALCAEIAQVAANTPADVQIHTIFFGGGTPTLLPATLFVQILNTLTSSFSLTTDCEISTEANPGTVDLAYLQALRSAGLNRISFGVQSAQTEELKLLDRLHSFDDVVRAVANARTAGFDNLNLDLIFGLPYQSMASWQNTLAQVLALDPEHFSLYALTLEHGTPMKAWVEDGILPMQDSDLAAEMYEHASATLNAAGYAQYEISNWSKPGLQCRHNLQYWHNAPYFGFGAGAHGSVADWRYSVVRSPQNYIKRMQLTREPAFPFSNALIEKSEIDAETAMNETMMLGLRLTQAGVSATEFANKHAHALEQVYGSELKRLTQLGLLEQVDDRVRITEDGRLLANEVFRHFV